MLEHCVGVLLGDFANAHCNDDYIRFIKYTVLFTSIQSIRGVSGLK